MFLKNLPLNLNPLELHRLTAQEKGLFHGQIGKTPFTTLTVNITDDGEPTTHIHRDSTNLESSFVAVFVDGGNYTGRETAFPELRGRGSNKMIAFSVRPGDLLLFDGVQLLHGNTPVKLQELGNRISYIAYAQETLAHCQKCPPEEECKPGKKLGRKYLAA